MEVIHVENLIKQYKNGVQALNGLALTVQRGEIFSLLGQNGAGKSTLINILTTYLPPTSGNVIMFGQDIYKEADNIRSRIACVAQRISIDTHLSLRENMMFQSKLYKIPKAESVEQMDTLITCFDLKRYLQYPVSSYSGGVKRRLDIALNMMSKPQVLFLDEPTVGMDIQSRMAMWNMMKKIRTDFGTTIFLTTHYLEEADNLSDTICIMKDGKEVVQGTPHALRKYLRQDMLKISFADKEDAKECFHMLKRQVDEEKADVRNDEIFIHSEHARADLGKVSRWLLDQHINFIGIEIVQPTLEDVFIRLTSKDEKEGC
ncbi:ABC transporter ATP-binding protein [Oscillospiraceae bacterium PP1C4]